MLKDLVSANGISFEKSSPDRILHLAADGMLWGKPGPCPECRGPMVFYNTVEYRCHGWATSFTRCSWKGAELKRYRWEIPDELKEKSSFLKDWERPKGHPEETYPKVVPLAEAGENPAPAAAAAAAAAAAPVEGGPAPMAVDAAAEAEVKRKEVVPKKRLQPKPGTDILKVDPDFPGNGEIATAYDDEFGWTTYHAMLNVTDLSTGANKFYRMQIIKTGSKYTFWIHWGRTGTDIGDSKAYKGLGLKTAIQRFEEKFEQCTGVDWSERLVFQKKPGKYNMIELDDGNENAEELQEVEKRRATKRQKKEGEGAVVAAAAGAPDQVILDQRVRDLVSLIFDKGMMVKALQVMKVDVKKMPLGKISKRQIQQAYAVLSSLSEALQQQPPIAARVQDCTNRFYTLVPHDFGEALPPIINTDELVKQKIELLDVLCDIEVANALMADAGEEGDKVLRNYQSLRTRITPIARDCDLWQMICRYAYDTHDASFFKLWTFTIDDIFEIEREGELERYKRWSDNPNRMLLWHGSRLTNYVGILSNGLRIAPPEAPKTGYRFGKGAYFADVSSKSGSYCFSTKESPTGIMILNEVAVGKQFETPNDIYMEKPQPGTDSTWALGMAVPDPKTKFTLPNGTVVPFGKPTATGKRTMCSHNEFIVYDVAQVVIRYLLRVTFHHK